MLSGTDHQAAKRRLAERAAQSTAWLASVLQPAPSCATSTSCATSPSCHPAGNSPHQPSVPRAEHSVVLSLPGHRVRRFGLQPRKPQHQTGAAALGKARVLKLHNPPAASKPAAASKQAAEHPAKRLCISPTSLQQPAERPLPSAARHSQISEGGQQQQDICQREGSLEPGLLNLQQQPSGKQPSLQIAARGSSAMRHTDCQAAHKEGWAPHSHLEASHKQCSNPSELFCPNCGDFLEDLADTESGRAAHVSRCHEDRRAAGESSASEEADENEEQRYRPDEETDVEVLSEGFCDTEVEERVSNSSPTGTDAAGNCQAAAATTAALTELMEPEPSIASWLHGIGCSQYTPLFMQAELSVSAVHLLTDGNLQQLGVAAMGPRRRILAAAASLHQADAHHSEASSTATGAGTGRAAEPAAEPQARLQGSVLAFASSNLSSGAPRTGFITDFFGSKAGPKPAQPQRRETCAPAQSAKRQLRAAPTCKARPGALGPQVTVPEWHKVPGTNFIVDRFGRSIENSVACKSWFLTHFHADHYGGLNGRFKSGLVYCTQITAKLANARLNVTMDRMRIVQLNEPIYTEGVRVTFLDANHCPGAAMILFEVPGRRPVLHSGDCRCHSGMQQEPLLQSLRHGKLDLYLDTTYCSSQYNFPSQQEVLRFVVDAFKAEKYNQNKTLFLFGSYTIGKERLFLEAARILQQKVYVSRAKRKVLDALDLPREYRALMTENDREATIQAVPMGMVNLKRMANVAKHYRSRFTTIVGIQPTGWTHSAERSKASRGRRLQRGSLILYSVPYSEHSSFPELREFVQWLQPRSIVPTVGNDRGPKARTMISLLKD